MVRVTGVGMVSVIVESLASGHENGMNGGVCQGKKEEIQGVHLGCTKTMDIGQHSCSGFDASVFEKDTDGVKRG